MKTKIYTPLFVLALFSTLIHQMSMAPAPGQSSPFTNFVQATGTVTVFNGFVIGVNLVNGGGGYAGPPMVSVMDPHGSNAVIVAAISGNGVVTNLAINNAGSHYSAGATLVVAPPATNNSPNDINVILTPYLTDDVRTWTAGTNYPFGGIYTNYGGIAFFLAPFPGITNGLGIVYMGLGSMTTPLTNNFPVTVTNAMTVYTMMNSDTGKAGFTNGTLDFYGSQGAHARFYIVQGFNIRDHYNGSYQNVVSSNLMSLYWGPSKSVRLDCQGWMLPTNFFSQTLTNIQVRSFGNTPDGVATVVAITVRTCAPGLAFDAVGNQAVCSWPSTPTNYVLQTTASLNNPAWVAASPPPVSNNQFVLTNLMMLTSQFYRLTVVP